MAIINDSNLTRKNIVADLKTMFIAFTLTWSVGIAIFFLSNLAARITGIK